MEKETIFNFTVFKNEGLVPPVTFLDDTGEIVNLSGYTAKLQIRKTQGATTVLAELSTDEGGGITITGASGLIEFDQDIVIEAIAELSDGDYEYDLVIYAPSTELPSRLFGGTVTIKTGVTREDA